MPQAQKKTAIWWIRRDLRLMDNHALLAACDVAEEVLPVFILDRALLNAPNTGKKRSAFLFDGLRSLEDDLRARGSRLIVREGSPVRELQKLVQETAARMIFAEEDYTPYARRREARMGPEYLQLTPGLTVHHPLQVVKQDGSPYTVFTPFRKTWKSLPIAPEPLPEPDRLITRTQIASDPIPVLPSAGSSLFSAGEREALRRLTAFTSDINAPIYAYHAHRDRPALIATSGLSPYLRFGMISARQAVMAALQARQEAVTPDAQKGAETWLNELIWREFFQAVLYHFPQVRTRSFRPALQTISWANDEEDFRAWCEGRTGYPIVDAAMRQLAETGWMHNRARMIVASFLTKDLLIDWRWGERWFMQQLVDGDPAANNGGWQWAAGTGTDAAPYFRIFNPVLQGKKFDPKGDYVRQWLPELKSVPIEFIHTPWEMPLDEQLRAACRIGEQYPAPIVEHAWARERALAAYRQ